MTRQGRRRFLQTVSSTAFGAAIPLGSNDPKAAEAGSINGSFSAVVNPRPMRLGFIVGVGNDPESAIRKVHDIGVPTCQVGVNNFHPEFGMQLRKALDQYGIEATSLVFGGPGPEVYDLYDGPDTIGFVPRTWRAARIQTAKKASDFARQLGIPAIQTHCGFIPENPNDPLYKEFIETMREVAGYCRRNEQGFRYETGQETPITLLRAILDVGLDNQGVNFDCGNLILYGKANPVDALDSIGKHVKGMHAKDGLYPTNPKDLGKQVPMGQGKVDFPALIRRLKELNYLGPVTIEQEFTTSDALEELRRERAYLEKLISG